MLPFPYWKDLGQSAIIRIVAQLGHAGRPMKKHLHFLLVILVGVTAVAQSGCVAQSGIARCNKAIKANPNDADAYASRAVFKRNRKDLNGAIADLTKAIGLKRNDPCFYINRGNARQGLHDYDGAIVDFDTAVRLSLHSSGATANNEAAVAYYCLSQAKRAKGDFVGAKTAYKKAVRLMPGTFR